jgi:hypothetical protein
VASIYRHVCLLRVQGQLDAAATLQATRLAEALHTVETLIGDSTVFVTRRKELFALEESRVQQAALTAQLVASLLSSNSPAAGANAPKPVPVRPAVPRAPLPATETDAIAGLIDGMLDQERHATSARR